MPAVLILFLSGQVFGFSFGTAPGYGAAGHTDPFPLEWLGAQDGVADGLTFGDFYVGALATVSIDVTLDDTWFDPTDPTDGDYLYVSIWADWNQDFVFANDEEIFSTYQFFTAGTTTLLADVYVPTDALYGNTWMRSRMTFDGPLMATGDYFTGEVEDYQIGVVPEPTTIALFTLGLVGAGIASRRKKTQ